MVISNCVVNLSPDKDAVLCEAFRVLKPGGRLAISDIVLRRVLPAPLHEVMGLWTGCIAGALTDADYLAKLLAAGFEAAEVDPTHVYDGADLAQMAGDASIPAEVLGAIGTDATIAALDGAVMSAFVRARKPSRSR